MEVNSKAEFYLAEIVKGANIHGRRMEMKKHFLTTILVSLTLIGISFSGRLNAAEGWPPTVVIGSFVKQSDSYPTNVAIAKLVGKYTPAKAVVREYAGGAPGLEALARGDVDTWGIGQYDLYQAYFGEGLWKGKPQDIRLIIGTWFYGPLAFGVRPSDKIHSLKDLAGRRCMVKSFIASMNDCSEALLRHAGVWDKIIVVETAGTGDFASAMIEKKVDTFLGGLGAAYSLQIKQSVGLDFISLSEEEANVVNRIPGMVPWVAPKWILETYGYPPDKVLRSFAYCFGIAVRADMPDQVAYGILEALYGDNHMDEVRSLSKNLTDASASVAAPTTVGDLLKSQMDKE